MSNPLSVENFEFKSGRAKTERSGKEILSACYDVMTDVAGKSPNLEFFLFKTYRRGEFFTPCLGVPNKHGVDDNKGATLYIRPGLRTYNQGFNPERTYGKLYIASGLSSQVAYSRDTSAYDEIEQSIASVREMRVLLTAKLGGMKLKKRRQQCLHCGQWIVNPDDAKQRPKCPTHGDNPPMWLAPVSSSS